MRILAYMKIAGQIDGVIVLGEGRRTFKPSLHIISQSLRDCSELVGFVNSTMRPSIEVPEGMI